MASLCWRFRSPFTAGHNGYSGYDRERLVARIVEHVLEDILALLASSERKARPRANLTVSRDKPSQRSRRWGPFLGPWCTGNGSLVVGIKLRRTEFRTDSRARAFTDADIPNGFAMPSDVSLGGAWRQSQNDFLARCKRHFEPCGRRNPNEDCGAADAHFCR